MPLLELPTGASLHYEDLRRGKLAPVICVHGLLGTARSQLGAVMDWLGAAGFSVIGLTLRGYGESLPKPRDFPDDFYARDASDLLAFMDALAIPRAHLLGYSDGGEVALAAAGGAPERFVSCLVIGAVGNYSPALRRRFQKVYPGHWITEAEKREHGIADAKRFTGEWVRATTRMIDAGGDISLSAAHKIACPLVIALGDKDDLNPRHLGERFVERAPRARLEIFPCGHAIQDEAFDAFCAMALRHLRAASIG